MTGLQLRLRNAFSIGAVTALVTVALIAQVKLSAAAVDARPQIIFDSAPDEMRRSSAALQQSYRVEPEGRTSRDSAARFDWAGVDLEQTPNQPKPSMIQTLPASETNTYSDAEWRKMAVGFEVVERADLLEHRVRIKRSKLCDSSVTQYTGYLDIERKKHLFFWFFEARKTPETAPLILWVNGGPGCSSTTGLLFELGPCNVGEGGNSTHYNPFSWTEVANTIFLDQPVGVGYSYAKDKTVNNSQDAARDVYAFLQLMYSKFPQYGQHEFHFASESYGGTYIPNFASYLFQQNQLLAAETIHSAPVKVHIPLTTLMIGNGVTDPLTQYSFIPKYACAPSKYAIFNETTCQRIVKNLPRCQELQASCYKNGSRKDCVTAGLYCWRDVRGAIQGVDRNPYDIRRGCNRDPEKDGPLCYPQTSWIESFMNRVDVRSELGVPGDIRFESCNDDILSGFQLAGDGMHNSAKLLPPLLAAGIRLLIYAGEMDYMCQWMGNKAWPGVMDSIFKTDYIVATDLPWITASGTAAGLVRTVGPGAGNLTYIKIYEAGHMVPFDQPEASLDMLKKWLGNEPFTVRS